MRLDATLHILSGKWMPLILLFLRGGLKRYGELKRLNAGVSDKLLIQQFKELEGHHEVARTDCQEMPSRVDCLVWPVIQ